MHPQSLKSKLLITVGLLTLVGYVIVVLLVSSRYSKSLENALEARGSVLAQSLAIQLTDLALVNDVTTIQRLLDSLVEQHHLSYAFVERATQPLAHTFESGMPQELLQFNVPQEDKNIGSCSAKAFVFSDANEVILDVACPIYEGKAGTVHLGISQKDASKQLMRLWLETALVATVVLALTLTGVFLLLRRLTRPLETLANVTLQVGNEPYGDELYSALTDIGAHKEIATLAASFQSMLKRLDEKSRKVARAHEQLEISNAIITGVAAQPSLQEMGRYLLSRCCDILRCTDIVLFFFDERHNSMLSVSSGTIKRIDGFEALQQVKLAAGNTSFERSSEKLFPPLVPERFAAYDGQMHIPILYESNPCGLFVSGCAPGCRCDKSEVALVSLVLGQVAGCLYRALEYEDALRKLHSRVDFKESFHGLVGQNEGMQLLYRRIEDVAPSDASVLIQGESGTGKELIAKAIHTLSMRNGKPFIVINCAAYPETLLESELFGHERGAFTGADKQRIGRFEQAEGGTVFLDEIGEISPTAQIKLLRVLQEKMIERLGSNKAVPVDVRIIAATNRILADAVARGVFREDLYYRLDVVSLMPPPLRERPGDVALLIEHYLAHFSREYNKKLTMSQTARQALALYNWPGNVRELENCLAQAALLAPDGLITPAQLPSRISNLSLRPGLEQSERDAIVKALTLSRGNKKDAAVRLGISRTTLYAKMKKYEI